MEVPVVVVVEEVPTSVRAAADEVRGDKEDEGANGLEREGASCLGCDLGKNDEEKELSLVDVLVSYMDGGGGEPRCCIMLVVS